MKGWIAGEAVVGTEQGTADVQQSIQQPGQSDSNGAAGPAAWKKQRKIKKPVDWIAIDNSCVSY